MSFLSRYVLACAFLLAWGSLAAAETAKVTFILVSDIYQMREQELADGRKRGGFARLTSLIKAERDKGGTVIVAHAGDTLSPSLMSSFDRGAHIVALTNMLAPSIFVPGNHEFDFGKATFLERVKEATFPLYGANLRMPDGSPVPGFKDRSIVQVGNVRIGLTGTTLEDTPKVSRPEDMTFLPTIDTLKAQTKALRAEGADFIAAVVHSNRGEDLQINAAVDVDLLLSGHDHDLFLQYDERTAIVESSYDAHRIHVIDVAIDVTEKNGKRTMRWTPDFRIVDTANVTPDPVVAAVVEKYGDTLAKEMDQPLGKTEVELDSRSASVRTTESAMGNLIADAMRAAMGADIAIANGGGIRGGKLYPAGTMISRLTVIEQLPFSNKLTTVRATGKQLKDALENGLRYLPEPDGRFPQISGMTVEADPSRPVGKRVIAVKVAGVLVDDARTYSVATNDYLARGKDGYEMLRASDEQIATLDDAPSLADAIIEYVRKTGTIKTGIEGRMILK